MEVNLSSEAIEELLEQPEKNVEYLENNRDHENYENEPKHLSYSQIDLDSLQRLHFLPQLLTT